jgi:hypothetical protein
VKLSVERWNIKTAEGGPASGSRLLSDDRAAVGAATRVVADLLDTFQAELDAIVLGTVSGDGRDVLDPHGLMRRAVQRAFVPSRGTVVISASERTVAAGLLEAGLRLQAGADRVGLVFVDWVSPAEVGVGLLLTPDRGVGVGVPRLGRCGPPPRRSGLDRGPFVGALRLADALEQGGQSDPVVLDRAPREGIAWTSFVGGEG